MATLDKRLTDLESKQSSVDLHGMTAEQLDAHLATLEAGSPAWFGVLIASISRKGSRLPIQSEPRRIPTA